MYPVFWIMTPILMGFFYLRSKSGETAYAKLREALEETDRTRFLELVNEAVRRYKHYGFLFRHGWILLAISQAWKGNPFPKSTSGFDTLSIDYRACYEFWRLNYLPNLRRQYQNRKQGLVMNTVANILLPVIIFLSFISSQESLSVLMVLSGVATIVMAVIGESGSLRRHRNLEAEEGMLDRLDMKFAELANQDQPAAG